MGTDPSTRATHPRDARQADRIAYGAVHLDVVDLERSLSFWRDVAGLAELPSDPGQARLGVDGNSLVVLHGGATRPVGRGNTGLYHLAIHLPDEVEFARLLVRLQRARVPQSPTDHIFSKATYVHDPDGIMLELTLETPERFGSIEIGPHTVVLFDRDGRRRGATEPLDFASAIAPLGAGDPELPLASGSYVGHVHLHVGDLEGAYSFYKDAIGFQEHTYMTAIGMADLSAGGSFPHRIALNDWHGPYAQLPPIGTAGLRRYELLLRDHDRLGALAEGASGATAATRGEDGSLSLRDPAGNEIRVLEATA